VQPPVVLIGDAPGRRDPAMTRLAGLLAPRFRVFSYERRRSGAQLEDLTALIAEARGPAALFGASSGALLALEAARTLAVTRLAVYEPPFMVDDQSPPPERIAAVRPPTLIIDGANTEPRLRRAARALWAVLPNVQHRTLEGQTHRVAPEALAPVLEKFFASSDSMAAART
jgi:pimeloyl-ACP methyl ester carboxylesterase